MLFLTYGQFVYFLCSAYFLLVVVNLIVSTSASDCVEILDSEMTRYVSSGM